MCVCDSVVCICVWCACMWVSVCDCMCAVCMRYVYVGCGCAHVCVYTQTWTCVAGADFPTHPSRAVTVADIEMSGDCGFPC